LTATGVNVQSVLAPLTLSTAVTSWTLDVSSVVVIVLVAGAYWWCLWSGARGCGVDRGAAWCFAMGIGIWGLATISAIAVYAEVLFWVRALQVLLLLFVAPMLIALGTPLTVLRNALAGAAQTRFDRLLATRTARAVAHPLTTSVAMLATPWLLYLTPWYTAALERRPVGAATEIFLLAVGFGYFYARLQADPVPRRYSQLLSMVISIAETIGDGLLGVVLWLGPLVAVAYYQALGRPWGPSPRVDQSIGAGVLWILGDVLGLPFLMLLVRALSVDEKVRAADVDAELDRVRDVPPERVAESTLWWENDPQLHDRFS
jgi:cytochrome c oxidase assembly factor CtaG